MVRRLIETNMLKYCRIIEDVGEIDINALDRSCANIDNNVGHIQKIIIKIPNIVENKHRCDITQGNEKRKKNEKN